MKASVDSLPLPVTRSLRKLGGDLAVARRKRRISAAEMAERLFVSRDTLWRMERGDPSVAIGSIATALFVLQLHDRLAHLASPNDDELGLAQEEARLPMRIRRSKKSVKL